MGLDSGRGAGPCAGRTKGPKARQAAGLRAFVGDEGLRVGGGGGVSGRRGAGSAARLGWGLSVRAPTARANARVGRQTRKPPNTSATRALRAGRPDIPRKLRDCSWHRSQRRAAHGLVWKYSSSGPSPQLPTASCCAAWGPRNTLWPLEWARRSFRGRRGAGPASALAWGLSGGAPTARANARVGRPTHKPPLKSSRHLVSLNHPSL